MSKPPVAIPNPYADALNAAPTPAAPSYTERHSTANFTPRNYIDPDNNLVTAKTYDEAQSYTNMGYSRATTGAIDHNKLLEDYSGWTGTGKAVAYGLLRGVPLGTKTLLEVTESTAGSAVARNIALDMQASEEAHPKTAFAATAVPSTAIAILSDVALTLGITTAASAATGPMAPLTALGAAIPSAMAASAVTSATMANFSSRDAAAIAHLVDPAAEEKIMADIGHDTLMAGAIGAAVPAGFGVLSKAAKGLGKASKVLAEKAAKKTIQEAAVVSEVIHAGANQELVGAIRANGLEDMPIDKAKVFLKKRIQEVGESFNEIKASAKAPMSAGEQGKLAGALGDTLGGEATANIANQTIKIVSDKPLTAKRLHVVRDYLDGHIEWGSTSAKNKTLVEAREMVNKHLDELFEANDVTGAQGMNWKAVNKEYSQLSLAQAALEKGVPKAAKEGVNWSAAAFVTAAAAAGHPLAALTGLAFVRKTAVSVKALMKLASLGEAGANLGKGFDTIGKKLAGVVESGLYGVPLAGYQATVTHKDYELKAAAVKYANANPDKAYAHAYATLAQAGLPDDMAGRLAARQMNAMNLLGAELPQPGPGIPSPIPSRAQPPQERRRAFISAFNAVNDPTYALRHPTARNLALHRAVYPTLHEQVQQGVIRNLQQNPTLPFAGKQWAGKVLGGAVDKLSTPSYYTTKLAAGQYQAASQKAKAAPANSGTGAPSSVNSGLTRAQSLANQR